MLMSLVACVAGARRDFARESFCFGSEAVNESGGAVRGLVKSPLRRSRNPSLSPAKKYGGSAAARPLTNPASYAGYVPWCKIFRQIFEDQENVQT